MQEPPGNEVSPRPFGRLAEDFCTLNNECRDLEDKCGLGNGGRRSARRSRGFESFRAKRVFNGGERRSSNGLAYRDELG